MDRNPLSFPICRSTTGYLICAAWYVLHTGISDITGSLIPDTSQESQSLRDDDGPDAVEAVCKTTKSLAANATSSDSVRETSEATLVLLFSRSV